MGDSAPRVPPRLRTGDTVGVASPSGGVYTPRRLARGVETLVEMGFRVVTGSMARPGERSALDRAAELNAFLRDPDVRAVFCTIGGYSCNGILDHVDYGALLDDPKILVGYSDITALLLAARTEADLVSFHGPTVLPELAEHPRVQRYTVDHLLRTLTQVAAPGPLRAAPRRTDEFLAWDSEDDRPRRLSVSPGWRWLCPGAAEGPMLGGNLETLCSLTGTRYLPDSAGTVLVCETASSVLAQIERDLVHLAMTGFLDQIVAVMFGASFRGAPGLEVGLHQLLTRQFGRSGIPVVGSLDLGHSDPMLTLPLGVRVHLDSHAQLVEVIDAAVS